MLTAANKCEGEGGYLAEPLTADLNSKFAKIAAETKHSRGWYNAGIVRKAGSWVGMNSTNPVNFKFDWEEGYPTQYNKNERKFVKGGYIYMCITKTTGKWANWNKNWVDAGICQKKR